MAYYITLILLVVLKLCGLIYADCYPGDSQYTAIVQEIYKNVTSDRISGLRGYSNSLTRSQLCNLLVNNHNNRRLSASGQRYTNQQFLGQLVSVSSCVNALTYTNGYDTNSGWMKWAGYHSGTWWSSYNSQSFSDGARWDQPYSKYDPGQTYAVQKVTFDSQWRKDHCTHVDQTGSTCRYGWNQSGEGIKYVWGWDPKNNDCPWGSSRGHVGAHVGFTFDQGTASCIIWVTSDEAFLECVKSSSLTIKKRSSCNHDGSGYGQWSIS